MLMENKFESQMIKTDLKFDLTPVCDVRSDPENEMKRKQIWELIVKMHYLSHELREQEHCMGVSPEFTRLVSGILREWAMLAEKSVSAAEAASSEDTALRRDLRSDCH